SGGIVVSRRSRVPASRSPSDIVARISARIPSVSPGAISSSERGATGGVTSLEMPPSRVSTVSGSAPPLHPVDAMINAAAASLLARILIVASRGKRHSGHSGNLRRFPRAGRGELDHDLGTALGAATCVDLAAPALHQATNDCQAESGAAGVGGESGFEHPFELVNWNPRTVITNDKDLPIKSTHCPARPGLSRVVKQVE